MTPSSFLFKYGTDGVAKFLRRQAANGNVGNRVKVLEIATDIENLCKYLNESEILIHENIKRFNEIEKEIKETRPTKTLRRRQI